MLSINRTEMFEIQLTSIGNFGEVRKERPGIREHLHTGIDIKRLGDNYTDEAIVSIGEGTVISVRSDGPFAQVIIEHHHDNYRFWSVYEHLSAIQVVPGDLVDENSVIGRFMNKKELNTYGWQFDHIHFELLKVPPLKIKPSEIHPMRNFCTYSLACFSEKDLDTYYFNPLEFLAKISTTNRE